jgi:hypothetical protein
MVVKLTVSGRATMELKGLDEALEFLKSEDLFRAIGEFMFWFSQLEAAMRARLAGALDLEAELFDIIIAPYDFAMLCTVLSETLKVGASAEVETSINTLINDIRGLNTQARIIIAHGNWTLDGARHVNRQKLRAEMHSKNPQEINVQTLKARKLTARLTQLGAVLR